MARLSLSAPSLYALILSFSVFSAAPALAQDLGMYRPGQAYQSVTSPGADVCQSHCAGDAQCSAWNYVKASPQAVGVCEFLASTSSPVPSQVSISGVNATHKTYARQTRPGSSHTVRVGTSASPAPKTATITQASPTRRVVREAVPQQINPQDSANRRRQLAYSRPQQAGQYRQVNVPPQYRQQNRVQNQPFNNVPNRTPKFRPFLDGAGAVPPARTAAGPYANRAPQGRINPAQPFQTHPNQGHPSQVPYAQQRPQPQAALTSNQIERRGPSRARTGQIRAEQTRAGQIRAGQDRRTDRAQRRRNPNVNPDFRQGDSRPPIGQPIGSKTAPARNNVPPNSASINSASIPPVGKIAPTARASNATPPRGPQPRSAAALPRASANAPITHENAREAFARRQADLAAIASGNSVDPIQKSLYGSLNDDVKVPVAVKNIPQNKNLPIATSASRPVGPVSREPLGELAGGPSR